MNLIRSSATFLLKGNIFIALCAVSLCAETSLILNKPFHSLGLYGFIFCSVLFTYNVYYFKSGSHPNASWLTFVGLAGAFATSCFIPVSSYFFIIMVSCLSAIYLLPAFISVRQSVSFTVQKLAILILVWVLMTFLVPAPDIHFNFNTTLFLLWRILLMSHLCLLFLIKDETHSPALKQISINACLILSVLQLMLAVLILFEINVGLGLVYFLIAIINTFISRYFNTHKKPDLYYLFFVDGIMILQTIFVLIKYLVVK